MHSWKHFDFLLTKENQWEKRVAIVASFVENLSDFWDFFWSSRMISEASWMKSGHFQGNFPVKVKTKMWSFLLYEFSRQKLGWQFTACCTFTKKLRPPPGAILLLWYVQRAVNRQPGFRSDQLVDLEFTCTLNLLNIWKSLQSCIILSKVASRIILGCFVDF